jgi:hypothetical protein
MLLLSRWFSHFPLPNPIFVHLNEKYKKSARRGAQVDDRVVKPAVPFSLSLLFQQVQRSLAGKRPPHLEEQARISRQVRCSYGNSNPAAFGRLHLFPLTLANVEPLPANQVQTADGSRHAQ